jgi:hypothetical protein
MPEINNTLEYSDDLKVTIKSKLSQVGNGFSYTNWSDNDLEPLRKAVRDFYKIEQKGYCAYCKKEVSMTSVLNCHVEHIVSKSKYIDFIFEPKNLCVICADCNQIKREQETLNCIPDTLTLVNGKVRKRYPSVSGGFKIVHPHFDVYEEHILIYGEFYVDLSLKGHFTIGACRLNRRLHQFGWQEVFHSENEIRAVMNNFLECSDSIKRAKILKTLSRMLIELGV